VYFPKGNNGYPASAYRRGTNGRTDIYGWDSQEGASYGNFSRRSVRREDGPKPTRREKQWERSIQLRDITGNLGQAKP